MIELYEVHHSLSVNHSNHSSDSGKLAQLLFANLEQFDIKD